METPEKQPLVGIAMGSDSDLPVMKDACEILDELEVVYEVDFESAHRTPIEMYQFAQSAYRRGIKVIIAGAGGAAHLPGMIAALTHLPVIGVPVQSKTMSGLDSLYSIVQMPPGVPVSSMAINGAKNAGLTAAKMLAISDEALTKRLIKYQEDLADSVISKNAQLKKIGWREYLAGMKK